jgi:hypothetical protein
MVFKNTEDDGLCDVMHYINGGDEAGPTKTEYDKNRHTKLKLESFGIGFYQYYNQRFFIGALDDFRIYNRPLTQSEIQEVMEARGPCGDVWADRDRDGDVDHDDFGNFQLCFTGADGGPLPDTPAFCECLDRPEEGFPSGDGDVDETDFGAFEDCATGPEIPLDPENPPANCEL